MRDAMSALEDLWQVSGCLPPKVPVPQPGPCPGSRKSPKTVVKKAVAVVAAPRRGSAPKVPKTFTVRDANKRLDAIYGTRFRVSGANNEIDQYLIDLARIPDPMHRRVNGLFRTREIQNKNDEAGIRIGVGSVIDVSPEAKRVLEARQASMNRSYTRVGGVYMGRIGQIIIGSQTVESGSTSRAAHEFGHALDRSAISVSNRLPISEGQPWRNAMETILASTDFTLHPYYTPTANAKNWLAEGFAESFAAWSKVADEPDRRVKVAAILNTLGRLKKGRKVSPQVAAAVNSMIETFDNLAKR